MCSRGRDGRCAASGAASARRPCALVAGSGLVALAALAPPAVGQPAPGALAQPPPPPPLLGIELLEPRQFGIGLDLFLASEVRSALVLEAGVADVRLDFHDRTVPADSTALEGRGPAFGVGLEAAAPLCRGCRVVAGAGYRYRIVPDLELERRGELAPPGQQVLGDRVVLDHDRHLLSARLGYTARRFTPYLGARARWSKVAIEDEVRFAGQGGLETTVTSRTVLESDAIEGLVGLDARLNEKLLGRVEVTFGDGGEGVLAKVVYLPRPELGLEVRRLARTGPRVTYGPNVVEIEGLVAGGWPVVVEYRLEEPGSLRFSVAIDGVWSERYNMSSRFGPGTVCAGEATG